MMLFDTVLSAIAPHVCIGCGREGSVLCGNCLHSAGEPPASRCAGCKRLTENYKTCRSCRSWLNIHAVYVSTIYEGMYEQLIHAYKFDVQRQAALPIASIMSAIPLEVQVPGETPLVLCPLPTATSRVRQRGFDHAKVLARAYVRQLSQSSEKNVRVQHVLDRQSNVRQLGSSRSERIKQMKGEFFISDASAVREKTVLLLDDVMTTGASLAAAAETLKASGAKRVYAIVFAQKV